MATITEDYVSFEVAKLLEEKGFNEYCPKSYFKMDKTLKKSGFSDWEKVNEIKAPTQSLVMKWLRKMHHIHIYTIDTFIGFKYVIQDIFHHDEDIHPIDGICFSSNEEACEEAIKYCIENII